MERIPFTGKELKLNGYYFQIWEDNNQKRFLNVTFLYEKGILLDIGGGGLLSGIDAFVLENTTKDFSKYKGFWGVFHIHNNSIKREKYYVGQTGKKYLDMKVRYLSIQYLQ